MKQQLWTLILFFILTTLARADDSIVMRVDSFQSVKQSIATARIADKYPITMGLKFDEIRCLISGRKATVQNKFVRVANAG